MFLEVFMTDEDDDEGLTCACSDPTQGGNVLYVASNRGSVSVVDIRMSQSENSYSQFNLHERKIACVDIHPSNGFSMSTASNGQFSCLCLTFVSV